MATWCATHGPRDAGDIDPCTLAPKPDMLHEAYVQAIRRVIIDAHPNPATRDRLEHVKLVYGAGYGMGARGVTFYGTWQNSKPAPVDTIEVCAFGEESPVQLCGTTIHELAHVIAGNLAGHDKEWKAACADLGLVNAEAGGQSYTWDAFASNVRDALQAIPEPTDGKPQGIQVGMIGTGGLGMRGLGKGPKPCPLGIGTRGGKSRGAGSGSRLRLWQCECGIKVRVGSDDFQATCNRCGTPFKHMLPA